MTPPITGSAALVVAVLFGALFGFLLHRGRVTDFNVIVNQMRLKDFTVLKVMLSAIIVGGLGVLLLKSNGLAMYHIKEANMLGVIAGGILFGIGMTLFGYCPGTALAAIGGGSLHALIGAVGMLFGGMLYAFSFAWMRDNVLNVWALGKARLPELTGVPDLVWFVALAAILLAIAALTERQRALR